MNGTNEDHRPVDPAQPAIDELSDADLIAAARAGSSDPHVVLYARHRDAAYRLAAKLGGPSNADDIVAESFAKVFAAMTNGGGPDAAFRPYLLATVRNVYVSYVRSDSHYVWIGDYSALSEEPATDDEVGARSESAILATAFRSLPERWQVVLWHTAVERDSHATVGALLGLSPNAVAALNHRAREGLRKAYLAEHLAEATNDECRATRQLLPSYARGQLGRRQSTAVEVHLNGCAACTAGLADLEGIDKRLGAVLGPILLGTLSATYLASVPGIVAKVAGLVKGSLVAAGTATATVAAGTAVAFAVVAGGGGGQPRPSADAGVRATPTVAVSTASEHSPRSRATPPQVHLETPLRLSASPPSSPTTPTPTTPSPTTPSPTTPSPTTPSPTTPSPTTPSPSPPTTAPVAVTRHDVVIGAVSTAPDSGGYDVVVPIVSFARSTHLDVAVDDLASYTAGVVPAGANDGCRGTSGGAPLAPGAGGGAGATTHLSCAVTRLPLGLGLVILHVVPTDASSLSADAWSPNNTDPNPSNNVVRINLPALSP